MKPTRHWFRFRLSTVLILTAIAAWGMATRPYRVVNYETVTIQRGQKAPAHAQLTGWEMSHLEVGTSFWRVERTALNPRLRWPALALLAFLTWKAAWAVVARRRRQSA